VGVPFLSFFSFIHFVFAWNSLLFALEYKISVGLDHGISDWRLDLEFGILGTATQTSPFYS
jgi:hypothetical protein